MKDDMQKKVQADQQFPDSPEQLLASISKCQEALSKIGPEIIGSLCKKAGKCTNPKCPCHQGMAMHFTWQLTSTARGRTRTVYVPMGALKQVKEWTANHKEGQKLRKEMPDLCERDIRTVVPRERASAKRTASEEKQHEED